MKMILVALFLLLSTQVHAEDFGLGVIIGSPTGLSANYLLSKRNSIDAALAYDDDDFHIHADYLWRFPKSLMAERVAFGWFTGIGLKIRDHDHDHHDHDDDGEIGPRAVIGMNYELNNVPIEFFGEAALIMYVIDETDLDLDLGIGARYYF